VLVRFFSRCATRTALHDDMKVRVSYLENVTDEFRRSIRLFYGQIGLATRQEVKDWFWAHGQSMNDDLEMILEDSETD
jgi:hypothetical protein